MHSFWGRIVAAAGAAVLALLPLPAQGAQAAPAGGTADVETQMHIYGSQTIPGATVSVQLGVTVHSGQVAHAAIKVTLPIGVTYESASGYMKCEPPVRGGRTVVCVPDRPMYTAGKMVVRVREDVVPGTVLTFTTTPVIDTGTVDTRPENDSKTARVTVVKPIDMASAWEPSSLSVTPGRPVTVKFVVTNHGPGILHGFGVDFSTDDSDMALLPRTVPPSGVTCIPDPGIVICEGYGELAPGESYTHTQTWVFDEQHAGRTIHAKAELGGVGRTDPYDANNTATLTFHVAGTAPSTPTTPSASTDPSPPAPGNTSQKPGAGEQLAETGTGPLATAAAGALLCAALGALLLRRRTRVPRSR